MTRPKGTLIVIFAVILTLIPFVALQNTYGEEKRLKECPGCGARHPSDYLFCPYDGTPLGIMPAKASPSETVQTPAKPAQVPPKASNAPQKATSTLTDDILIRNEGYKTDKKGPVKLTHRAHSKEYKIACTDCHHDYQDGKNVWKEEMPAKNCRECHNPLKKQGKVMKLQIAYHKNCKNCHKDLAKEGKKTGPHKKCKECHQKKT